MCIGDDNTRGSFELGDTAWCYRANLKKMLEKKQWNVDFSGTSEIAPIGGTWHTELKGKLRLDPARNPGVTDKYDIQHDGYVDAPIETFTNADSITSLLNGVTPDIVLLMVGTVNLKNNDTVAADIVTKETALVDKIHTWLCSNGRSRNQRYFFLGNIPIYEGKEKYVSNLNLTLSQQNWGERINGDVVDIHNGMNFGMLQSYLKYRCKKSGLEHISNKWYNAIYRN